MTRSRALVAAYVAAPGALAAFGLLSDRVVFLIAGHVLGLPLSLFGNALIFLAAALVIRDPTAEGPGVTAFTVALTAVTLSGGAALQALVARAVWHAVAAHDSTDRNR